MARRRRTVFHRPDGHQHVQARPSRARNRMRRRMPFGLYLQMLGEVMTDIIQKQQDGNGWEDLEQCLICRDEDLASNLVHPCPHCRYQVYHYHCLCRWIRATRDQPCIGCGIRPFQDRRIRRTYGYNVWQHVADDWRIMSFYGAFGCVGAMFLVMVFCLFPYLMQSEGVPFWALLFGISLSMALGFGMSETAIRLAVENYREWLVNSGHSVTTLHDFDGIYHVLDRMFTVPTDQDGQGGQGDNEKEQ